MRRSAGRSARAGSFSHEIRDVRDSREQVLVSVVLRAEGTDIGGGVEQPGFHLWTLRDSQIVRLAWFHGHDEALEAAGLASSSEPRRH